MATGSEPVMKLAEDSDEINVTNAAGNGWFWHAQGPANGNHRSREDAQWPRQHHQTYLWLMAIRKAWGRNGLRLLPGRGREGPRLRRRHPGHFTRAMDAEYPDRKRAVNHRRRQLAELRFGIAVFDW